MVINSRAPLRVGFSGGGTDIEHYYKNHGGLVLNCTIDLYAHAKLTILNKGTKSKFSLLDLDVSKTFFEKDFNYKSDDDFMLLKAVYKYFLLKFKVKYLPIKLETYVDAPPGSGLGSSSTLVVCLVAAFSKLFNLNLNNFDLAEISYEIERKKLKISGGKQDQYAAVFGGFNWIEFKKNKKVIVHPIKLTQETINELESRLLLYYTGRSRSSSNIIKDQISSVKKNDSSLNALHELKNNAIEIKNNLLLNNIDAIGKLLDKAWSIKKSSSKSITNDFLNNLYSDLKKNGVIGGKISGAGGGGFMCLFLNYESFCKILKLLNKNELGLVHKFRVTHHGVHTW